jgi:hypothetical protein
MRHALRADRGRLVSAGSVNLLYQSSIEQIADGWYQPEA